MSADNGVYIGRFLEDGKYTYRVIHAQAIENCDKVEDFPHEMTEAYRVSYYGNAKAFTDEDEARKEAFRIYDEIMESDFPIVEYGVSSCCYDEPFPKMTLEEARDFLDKYWENYQLERGHEYHRAEQ